MLTPIRSPIITAPKQGIIAPAWTPKSVANLDLWFHPDSGFTAASGAISQWNDASGNSRNASQGTAAATPTLVTNGYPAAKADGGDFLSITDYAHSTTALTGFVVVRVQSVSTTQSHLAHWDTNAQRAFKFGVSNSHVNFRSSNGGTTIEKNY